MSVHRPTRLGLVAMIAVAPLLALAAPASADPACTTPVIDTTDKHVLDVPAVTARVTDMRNATGADVYVRAFQATPGGSSAAWWTQAYRSCPAWLSADGKTPKPNLLVVQFGMDRTSAIEYGSNFHQLDPKVDRIRADMGARLRQSDFTGAVTNALTGIQTALGAPSEKGTTSSPAPVKDSPGSRGIVKFAFIVLGLVAAIVAGWLFFVVVRILVRRREEAKETRRRLDAALRKLSSAQSDATAAVLESGVESAKIRAASFAEKAESTVDLGAFAKLLSRRDELSGEFNRRSADPTPTTESEVLNQVATLTRITADLRTVNSDADKLADAVEAKAASCTPERKRSDLQAEMERLRQQAAVMSVDGVDLSDQRAVVESKRAELSALAESITASSAPTREAVDASLRDSAAVRSTVAQKISRASEVIDDLHRIGGQVSRIAEQYSREVPGVSSDAAERAIAAAFEVGHAADVVKGSIPAAGAQLATLAPQVDGLMRALRAATDEVSRQAAEHRAAERKRQEEERAQKRREEDRRRARSRSYGSSSGSDYGSGYGSGVATGLILGSSSSSSSSSDFGGGSSGGWDSGSSSGSSDFGGGSSGSW